MKSRQKSMCLPLSRTCEADFLHLPGSFKDKKSPSRVQLIAITIIKIKIFLSLAARCNLTNLWKSPASTQINHAHAWLACALDGLSIQAVLQISSILLNTKYLRSFPHVITTHFEKFFQSGFSFLDDFWHIFWCCRWKGSWSPLGTLLGIFTGSWHLFWAPGTGTI